jgi:hypothetical protein
VNAPRRSMTPRRLLAALAMPRSAALAVRERVAEILHTRSLTDARATAVALMGDLTDANGLEPTAEECMAPTLRSVAPAFCDAPDSEQAPSTDSCSSLALEFGP